MFGTGQEGKNGILGATGVCTCDVIGKCTCETKVSSGQLKNQKTKDLTVIPTLSMMLSMINETKMQKTIMLLHSMCILCST